MCVRGPSRDFELRNRSHRSKTDGVSAFIPQHIFLDSTDGLPRWELAYRGLELELAYPGLQPEPDHGSMLYEYGRSTLHNVWRTGPPATLSD